MKNSRENRSVIFYSILKFMGTDFLNKCHIITVLLQLCFILKRISHVNKNYCHLKTHYYGKESSFNVFI